MAQQSAFITERRTSERFTMRLPVTLFNDEQNASAFTRDISDRGIFFYFPLAVSAFVDQELDFIVEFPPEVTLCTSLKVRCIGKVVRKQNTAQYETGVAVRICKYTFLPDETSVRREYPFGGEWRA